MASDVARTLAIAQGLFAEENPFKSELLSTECVNESDISTLTESFKRGKQRLLDLQTKRNIAASVSSDRPFAAIDTNTETLRSSYASAKTAVRAIKRDIEDERRALTAIAEQGGSAATTFEQLQGALKHTASELEEALADTDHADSVTVDVAGERLELTSESQARSLATSQTLLSADMRTQAMSLSMDAVRTNERCKTVSAEIDALESHLQSLQRQRATKAHAMKTEAEKAEEAALYFTTMTTVLHAMLKE